MQPITQSFVQAARDAGGDAIDLDPADGSFSVSPTSPSTILLADEGQLSNRRTLQPGGRRRLRCKLLENHYRHLDRESQGPGSLSPSST
jgi:hypothetical protein